ncbi:MAG: phosphoglucosamine mutase [Bryobacter sp.]
MSQTLRISTAGVRGIVGPGLEGKHALEFAAAFSVFLPQEGPVLLARDPRASSDMLREGVIASLLASGRDAVDLGLVSTPVLQHAIRERAAAGGISIGASHNAAPWNALKFFGSNGTYLNSGEAAEFLDIYHLRRFHFVGWEEVGKLSFATDAVEHYLAALEAVFDIGKLRGVRLVADCSSGLSSILLNRLREKHGLNITLLNASLENKHFSHEPNTTARNVNLMLAPVVEALGADLGVLFDMDSDRIAVCGRDGKAISEELVLPLLADYQLARLPGRLVITNLSTTALLEDIAAQHGGEVVRVPVGRQHAMDALAIYAPDRIAIAGEGTGAVMLPEFRFVYDGMASLLALMSLMVERGKTLSELVAAWPAYDMRKHEVPLDAKRIPLLMMRLEEQYHDFAKDTRDGLRVTLPYGWFHVRVSNTEPVVRIIVETRGNGAEELARELLSEVAAYA